MPAAGGVAVIPPDGRGVEAGQLYWLAAEKKGTIKFGDMVPKCGRCSNRWGESDSHPQ